MFDFKTITNRYKNKASKWLKIGPQKDEELVIPMSVADMEFQTAPQIKRAIQDYVDTEVLGYTHPNDEYYESVLGFFKDFHNFDGKKEWLVTTPGVVPALATSVRAYTKPGDKVIVMPPVYPPFFEVVEGQDREISECPLIEKDDEYFIDYDLLEELAKEGKLIFLCSPHNPTGRVWSEKELEKVSEIAFKNDVIVISDEIHSDIMMKDKNHIVYGNISKKALDNSVICTAASKTFNIAGLQCSNVFISNENLREKFVKANLVTGIERANILGLIGTKAAYDIAEEWIPAVKDVIKENLEILIEFLEKHDDKFSYTLPDASFLVWVNFEKLGIEHDKFIEILSENKIIVNDGKEYGQGGKNHIRINLGLPKENLKQNLETIENIIEEV